MANPNQCYLSATICSGGSGVSPIYVLKKAAQSVARQTFVFQYGGNCYTVNPGGPVVTPPPPATSTFVKTIGPLSDTCDICASGCTLTPPAISFCPGTAGSQTISGTTGVPNGAWSASVACSVSADVTVSPGSGTSDANGDFSFTVSYNGADSNTQTCTVTVTMAGCADGAVDVDISPLPANCPTGLAASYTVGGGPFKQTNYPNPSTPCATCEQCGTTAEWDGVVPQVSGCCYVLCSATNMCWDAYLLTTDNPPITSACDFSCPAGESALAAIWLEQGAGWLLRLTGSFYTGSGTCQTTGSFGWTKLCGGTPRGVYTSSDSGYLPQTLYVY